MRALALAVLFGLTPAQAAPLPPPKPDSNAEVVSITDGDTLRIRDGETSMPVRILGLDTPELRRYGNGRPVPLCETAMADQARTFLEELVTRPGVGVIVYAEGFDRYGRVLAWISVGGRRVDEVMIEAGLARPYFGGTRRGEWC